jgi:hypothetical protein
MGYGRRALISLLAATALAGSGLRLEGQAGGARPATAGASAAQEEKFAPARTTVDRILARFTRELGGLAAWQKAASIVSRGECQFEGSESKGTAVLYQRPPNRVSLELNIPGIGVSRQVIDGNRGWASSPGHPARELTGAELAQGIWDADFYKEVSLQRKYRQMKLRGIAPLDGHRVYVIDALPTVGKLQRLYFEVASGMLARVDLMQSDGTPVIAYYADYRNFQGLYLPVVWHTVTPQYTLTVRWTKVEINRPVSESVFRMPAASQ